MDHNNWMVTMPSVILTKFIVSTSNNLNLSAPYSGMKQALHHCATQTFYLEDVQSRKRKYLMDKYRVWT